jgi:acetamidase/formamidase
MSNRFKKSIESLENTVETPEINTDGINETKNNSQSELLTDVLNTITTKEPQGKNVAFYLSLEVDEAVTKISKQKNISKSKLVDIILKQVLLQERK